MMDWGMFECSSYLDLKFCLSAFFSAVLLSIRLEGQGFVPNYLL